MIILPYNAERFRRDLNDQEKRCPHFHISPHGRFGSAFGGSLSPTVPDAGIQIERQRPFHGMLRREETADLPAKGTP